MRSFKLFIFLIIASTPATDWYVRPAGGNYGAENGTSYSNAWDGLKNVVWGANGVKAGDTLYICGLHIFNRTNNTLSESVIEVTASGTGENSRITIRGDYPDDPGITWGGCKLNWGTWTNEGDNTYSLVLNGNQFPDWWMQDVSASNWTVLTPVNSVAECKSTAGSVYSVGYAGGSTLYVHCSDGGNPTGRIVAPEMGWRFSILDQQYITFKNLKLYNPTWMWWLRDDNPSTHLRWDGCTIWYGESNMFGLLDGMYYYEWINCDLGHSGNGIAIQYTVKNGGNDPHDGLIQSCYFHDMGVRTALQNPDAHAIGVNGGHDWIIEKSEFYNCGTTICLYALDEDSSIWNFKIRWNYIHDTHNYGGAPGMGIELACGAAHGDCSGHEIYGNIVARTNGTNGTGIRTKYHDLVKIYNNVVYNAGNHSF